jgi:hypothetical protein
LYTTDKLNKTATGVHYDDIGKTGYISIDYYDDNGNVIVDEGWKNDTLVNLNLYKDGNWHKNYNINKSWKTTIYKLIKEPHCDSLKYIYKTIENGEEMETEIIKVKKLPLTRGFTQAGVYARRQFCANLQVHRP